MPRMLRSKPAPRQPQISTTRVVGELTRIATASGGRRQATADPKIRELRKNVAKQVNRCVPSLVALLTANGRGREFAVALALMLDPVPRSDLHTLNREETRLDGALDELQMAYQSGERDGVTLARIEQVTGELLPILTAMHERAARDRRHDLLDTAA